MRHLVLFVALAVAAPVALAQNLPSWAEAPPPPEEEPTPQRGGADPGRDDCGGFPCPPPDPDPIPVDGGLALLALAGGAYAVRRLRSNS